ncbi:MAG: hypothetical protein P8N76_17525 [Pirellulaceae bacterium]|nr:hypothetical protein [Pirellulaceae bacterium]
MKRRRFSRLEPLPIQVSFVRDGDQVQLSWTSTSSTPAAGTAIYPRCEVQASGDLLN